MAMTPEAKVKAKVKAYLKSLPNCWWFMPVSAGYGQHGIPDFIICYQGRFIAIETKAPGREGTVTPLQASQIAGIRAAGGEAWVVSEPKDLDGCMVRAMITA